MDANILTCMYVIHFPEIWPYRAQVVQIMASRKGSSLLLGTLERPGPFRGVPSANNASTDHPFLAGQVQMTRIKDTNLGSFPEFLFRTLVRL